MPAAAVSCSADTGRDTSESIVSTTPPVSSAASTDSASGPHGASRTRSAEAPSACSSNPFQAKASFCSAASSAPADAACSAASSSAGCRANLPASLRTSLGQRDLGEDVVTAPPHRPQPLERRSVAVTALVQAGVEAGDVDLLAHPAAASR